MALEIQTTLLGTSELTLDTTCSEKKVFPAFASLRMDVRREAGPDVIASAEYLPFRSGIFGKLYCDPPHMFNSKPFEKPKLSAKFASRYRKIYPHEHFLNCVGRFGYWLSQKDWFDFLEKTNEEFARVLKADGTLEYKLCETGKKSVKFVDLEKMSNFRVVGTKDSISKFGHNPTRYFTMKTTGVVKREESPA